MNINDEDAILLMQQANRIPQHLVKLCSEVVADAACRRSAEGMTCADALGVIAAASVLLPQTSSTLRAYLNQPKGWEQYRDNIATIAIAVRRAVSALDKFTHEEARQHFAGVCAAVDLETAIAAARGAPSSNPQPGDAT